MHDLGYDVCMIHDFEGEFYRQIEGLENQLNQITKHYGGNIGGNDEPRQNRMEGQNRIEGVKLNVHPFKDRSDLDAYLD